MINTFNFFKIFVNCMNGGVKIRKRMTIPVLLLIFTILSISSVSANEADNNIAIDEAQMIAILDKAVMVHQNMLIMGMEWVRNS